MSVSSALRCKEDTWYTEEDVRRVVDTCPLQRFTLRTVGKTGELQIRANFLHSIRVSVVRSKDLDMFVCVCMCLHTDRWKAC